MTFNNDKIKLRPQEITTLFNLLSQYATWCFLSAKTTREPTPEALYNGFCRFVRRKQKDETARRLMGELEHNVYLALFLLEQLEEFIRSPECLIPFRIIAKAKHEGKKAL